NAFHINRSKDIALKDIRIYHAGGMGVICERSENILLEKVQILARPGSGRMVSTGADATHFVSCRGFVKMNNCVFRNMLDDGTNVHSAYLIIDTIMSRRSVGVRVGHPQQRGFLFAEKGDKVGFVERALSTIPKFFNTVEAIDHVNEQFYILTFKEDLPDNINSDLVIENLDWYPELSITNCTVADNRARGFLISTPRKAIIENNYFSTMMSGILIPEELSYWYESGQAQNVLIRNNQFGDCSYGGGKTPVIQIHTAINKAGYAFGRIVIEGNRFHHFDAAILQANSAKSLEFVNNRITRSKTFQPLHPHLPVLQFDHIQNLKVRSNSYDGSLRGKVLIKDIEFSDVDL
ncbi:MAG TPA: right-handed parallel beta-helix repeat-containing protein, partial [Niabella sp.]|nr:right-handed parallel beta-helix repeat-containing protein [Niabella sp.]